MKVSFSTVSLVASWALVAMANDAGNLGSNHNSFDDGNPTGQIDAVTEHATVGYTPTRIVVAPKPPAYSPVSQEMAALGDAINDAEGYLDSLLAELPYNHELQELVVIIQTSLANLIKRLSELQSFSKRDSMATTSDDIAVFMNQLQAVGFNSAKRDKSPELQENLYGFMDLIVRLNIWIDRANSGHPETNTASAMVPASTTGTFERVASEALPETSTDIFAVSSDTTKSTSLTTATAASATTMDCDSASTLCVKYTSTDTASMSQVTLTMTVACGDSAPVAPCVVVTSKAAKPSATFTVVEPPYQYRFIVNKKSISSTPESPNTDETSGSLDSEGGTDSVGEAKSTQEESSNDDTDSSNTDSTIRGSGDHAESSSDEFKDNYNPSPLRRSPPGLDPDSDSSSPEYFVPSRSPGSAPSPTYGWTFPGDPPATSPAQANEASLQSYGFAALIPLFAALL